MADFSLKETLKISLPSLTILDVGAGTYGGELPYRQLVEQELAEVIGVEPNPAAFDSLCQACEPHYHFLPHCLGRGGMATFHLTAMPQCSSIYLPDLDLINQFIGISRPGGGEGPFSIRETVSIETEQLDDVIEPYRPDYIKLDTQGAELDILMGAQKTLKNVLVIQTEVEFIPLYKNQPLFGDIQVFLREQGFWFQKFIDIQGRNFLPLVADARGIKALSQALWADAIFVRDYSNLDNYSDEQLLKTSLIMHEFYNSYDFVQWLLKAYDRRQNTNLFERYLTTLTQSSLNFKYMNLVE
jgi:FkbM family methyltransferase